MRKILAFTFAIFMIGCSQKDTIIPPAEVQPVKVGMKEGLALNSFINSLLDTAADRRKSAVINYYNTHFKKDAITR
jgi:hypothetical protein